MVNGIDSISYNVWPRICGDLLTPAKNSILRILFSEYPLAVIRVGMALLKQIVANALDI